MSKARSKDMPRIADRLAGRRLLVTGATGLLGKVFVEKLLRCVPRIGSITLLVRSRPDGLTGEQRVQTEILGSSVFERLIALLGPQFETLCRKKIRVVVGDLTSPRLGLSDQDYDSLCGKIDTIINSAAAVTFDERLDVALHLNTLGPARMLKLAQDFGDVPMMQVSTCYVSGKRGGDVPEKLAGPVTGQNIDLDEVIERMKQICAEIKSQPSLSDEALRRRYIDAGMELAHQHGWNDTYTFTKWLGEQLLDRDRGKVPMVILRPAIIESSHQEPVPGWIDGLRMADPMIMAFGRGKLEEFPADSNIAIDFIPVDYVANAMIVALPAPTDPAGLKVYQSCSSQVNPLRLSELARCVGEGFRRRPMTDEAGRPIDAGEFKLVRRDDFLRIWKKKFSRLTWYKGLLERLGVATERRRKISAVLTQIEQIIYFAKIYSPYTHLDCRYLDHKLRALGDELHPEDRDRFRFGAEHIDWADYLINRHIPGLRKFVLGGAKDADPLALRAEATPVDDESIRAVQQKARTIFEMFQGVAEICGDKTALQMRRDGRWVCYSYRQTLAATAAIARRFGEVGLTAGDRVAICSENSPEWGLTYLATLRAGLTAVPLDPLLPADDILQCTRFAKAKLICAGRSTFDAISAAIENHDSDDLPPIVQMTGLFVPPPGASRDPGPPPVAVEADDIASILFTSGTTVAPKVVPLTHTNLLANALGMLEVHPLRSRESFISVLPMYHAFEFTAGFLLPMSIGSTITFVEQLKGPEVLAIMQVVRPTIMLVVPRLLKLFYDAIQNKVRESGIMTRMVFRVLGSLADLSRGRLARTLFAKVHRQFGGELRMFISGGSALDPELYTGFSRMGFEVCEGYGLTETAPVLTVTPPGRGKLGSPGRALPGVELEIRNANNLGVGELWARGSVVMSGYLDNPQATAEVMRDGWFRTGDLCRRDGDGYYFITGRVKDMIVTDAGKNVYPDEVEVRYKNLPYVLEMCVLGMPSSSGLGEAVHAVIVPDYQNHPDLDPSAIERTIREEAATIAEQIPTHQRIQSLHFWNAELPKTSTLKAKRGLVQEMLKDGGQAQKSPTTQAKPPAKSKRAANNDGLSKGQIQVRKILSELTRESESSIRPDSNLLLDLGVDSLMKLQLISELEAHFDLVCSNENASALARVQDVYTLVGDRSPRRGKAPQGRSWRERADAAATTTAAGPSLNVNGRWSLPAASARLLARGSMAMFFRSYLRVRVRGLEHIPATGPFIITPNHSSHVDSVAVLTAIGRRRRVWVAGAADYFFDTPLKSWLFGSVFDIIPFDRHSEGFDGLGRCMEVLKQNQGLLFFPEGTRSQTGLMGDFKIGAALLAVEAGATLVPTRIENAFELLPKGRRMVRPGVITVTFGPPLQTESWKCSDDLNKQYHLYRELARHLSEQVAQLGQGPREKTEER